MIKELFLKGQKINKRKWKYIERLELSERMKDLKIKTTCECGIKHFIGSETYRIHMLFYHQFLVPECSTKQKKKLELNYIIGWAVRDERRAIKRQDRTEIYMRKLNLWNHIIRKYLNNDIYTSRNL